MGRAADSSGADFDDFAGWKAKSRSGGPPRAVDKLVPPQQLPPPSSQSQKSRRDSMFGSMLEDGHHGLYTEAPMPTAAELAATSDKLAPSPLLAMIERCLGMSMATEEAKAAHTRAHHEERRRQWADDLKIFFEEHGTRIELEPGDVLVSPDAIGVRRGLDCAYFVLSGAIVEESRDEGGDLYYPAGSVLNTDCFLQGLVPTTALCAVDSLPAGADDNKSDGGGSHKKRAGTARGGSPTSTSSPQQSGRTGREARVSSETPRGATVESFRRFVEPTGGIQMLSSRGGSFYTGGCSSIGGVESFSNGRNSMKSSERGRGTPSMRASRHASSLEAQARAGTPTRTNNEPTIVASLDFARALQLIRQEPYMTRRFFVAMAAGLTELLNARSNELRSAVRAIGSQATLEGTSAEVLLVNHHDRTAAEIESAFELPEVGAENAGEEEQERSNKTPEPERMLLASCDCHVSVERASEFEWKCVKATAYLLSTHLCIEKHHPLQMLEGIAPGCLDSMIERRAFSLKEVLGLLDQREASNSALTASKPGGGRGSVKGLSSKDKASKGKGGDVTLSNSAQLASKGAVVGVQIKGGTVQMALPAQLFDMIVREVEIARLAATDTSNLAGHEKEKASKVSGWSVLRASWNAARGKPMQLGDVARAAVMQSRRSFVSTGSGLTPRLGDIAANTASVIPERESNQVRGGKKGSGGGAADAAADAAAAAAAALAAADAGGGDKGGEAPPADGSFKGRRISFVDFVNEGGDGAPQAVPSSSDGLSAPNADNPTYILDAADWRTLLAGARYRKYRQNTKVIAGGQIPDGLIQVVTGTLRVELPQVDRPQALVLGKLNKGDIIGERSLLLGTRPSVDIVCDSEMALTLRLPKAHLAQTFISHPEIAAKFFCLNAVRTAARLRKINEQELTDFEHIVTKDSNAPTTMLAIAESPAFFLILHKFVLSSQRFSLTLGPTLNFIQEARMLLNEPDIDRLAQMVSALHKEHIDKDAPRPLACLSDKMRKEVTGQVGSMLNGGHSSDDPQAWRHIFDVPVHVCMKAVDDACFKNFLSSRHYQYVLTLKSKELIIPTIEHFRIASVLGTGGFGQVVKVVKRDCGLVYAMKVQKKAELESAFGEAWEKLALTERKLLGDMHHPLLVNLAYAFQTIDTLNLVMDACPNGDLARFGVPSEKVETPSTLEKEQVRFIALEVACVLRYLHSKRVLFRDMKCENLLLDALGHVRLIDFGVSKQAKEGKRCVSTEECGTVGYMAPEVFLASSTRQSYSYEVDWFSYGVVVYELCEQALPFGPEPMFESVEDEFRNPELIDEDGVEVPHLYDMLAALLDWDPKGRLKDDTICDHPYWQNADWELADRGRLISPLLPLLDTKGEDQSKRERRPRTVSVADGASLEIAKSLEVAQKRSAKADADEEGGDGLAEQALLMHVDGWDFVSEHALAREYVVSAADVISIV